MSHMFKRRFGSHAPKDDFGRQVINPMPFGDSGANVSKVNNTTIADQSSPSTEIPFTFADQSVFQTSTTTITDDAYAILPQPVNQPIVPSTLQKKQNQGYALALSADSECPVAVIFKANGQRLTSTVQRLLPGQIIRPHGLPRNFDPFTGSFSGFDFGLPFGWLGGGIGRLIVFKTEDSYLRYIGSGNHNVLIHQVSQPILAADTTATPQNWPKDFPWINARSQLDSTLTVTAASIAQGAPAQMATIPTRVTLELQCSVAGLAMPITVSVYVHYDGASIPIYDEVTFPACPAGTNSYVDIFNGVLNEFAAPGTQVNFVSGTMAIQGLVINCYRYATLS